MNRPKLLHQTMLMAALLVACDPEPKERKEPQGPAPSSATASCKGIDFPIAGGEGTSESCAIVRLILDSLSGRSGSLTMGPADTLRIASASVARLEFRRTDGTAGELYWSVEFARQHASPLLAHYYPLTAKVLIGTARF